MEKGKLLLEYDRRLLPDGVSQSVRRLSALGRSYGKDPAGLAFHQCALRQAGLLSGSLRRMSRLNATIVGLEEEDVSESCSESDESESEEHIDSGLSNEEMPAGAKFKKAKKPKNTVKSTDVDYYKLLGLEHERWTATDDQIVKAYRKVCLKMHPDKVAAGSEAEREKAEDRFKEIQEAYNILSDETSRRLYDSTDAFDDTLPVDCDPADFFKVFSPAFKRYARWSVDKDVAELGDEETDWDIVSRFYDFWYGFKSWREFPHPDEEDLSQAEGREHRRLIERQNQKLREKAKKEEGKRIREFVDNAYRIDPRVTRQREAEKQARLEKKKEKTKAREEREALVREREEREAAQLQEQEDAKRQQQEEERKIKEAEKKLLKEQRKRLRDLCTENSLLDSQALDFICLRLDKPKLEKLSTFLEKELTNPEKCKAVLKQTVGKLEEQEKEASEKRAAEQEAARKAYEKTRKQEANKKIEAMREWTEEELKMLDKALNKFPQGTRKRWEQVTNYVRTRTQDEVLIMVKQRQGASSKRFEAQQNWRTHKDRDIHSEPTVAEASFTDVQLDRQRQGCKEATPSETAEWSKEEELSLVKALKAVGKDEADRWGKIAERIPGRSKAECFKRFKQLKETFRSSQGNSQPAS